MGPKTSKKIIVIDPALMAAGGHHAGFAEMAASSISRQKELEVEFVSHENVDETIRAQVEQALCVVRAEFSINFYEYFDQSVTVADIQPYVLQVTKEYIAAIQSTMKHPMSSDIIFFYPSLTWEHAYCLALALTYLTPALTAKHIVCAMFNPAIDFRGKTTNHTKKLNYTLAFKALDKHKSVQLYASDQELASAYAKLLDRVKPLPLHPCYLADWSNLNSDNHAIKRQGEPLKVTIYMGDAKENKGFLLLSRIASEILADKLLNIELTVQYTLAWADETVREAAEKIVVIAREDKRLVVTERFLSDNELHNHLEHTDLFIFTYKAKVYQDKSSGLLWLIGWYKTPVYFLNATWLSREAQRLQLPVLKTINDPHNLKEKINQIKNKDEHVNNKSNLYRTEIYRPFWHWIASV